MSKSIKLKDDNYWDSSSIVHKQRTLDVEMDGVQYMMPATIGWKRIARLENCCVGEVYVINYSGYGMALALHVSNLSGWSRTITKTSRIFTNGGMFTKARLVYKNAGNVYLELYQNLEYERNMVVKGVGIGINVYNNAEDGNVPDDYKTIEIDI